MKFPLIEQPSTETTITGTPARAARLSSILRIYWPGCKTSSLMIVCDDDRDAELLAEAINAGIAKIGEREAIEPPAVRPAPLDISETRPPRCRMRLEEEGKPYPRSGCDVCGPLIRPGWSCPHTTGSSV